MNGKPRSKKLGEFPAMGVAAARKACRDFEMNPDAALARTKVGSFAEVAEQFLERHVRKNGLRSRVDVERHFAYANKYWRYRPFPEIRRRHGAELLDKIEDAKGANVAEDVRQTLSKMMRWYESRGDDYCVIDGPRSASGSGAHPKRRRDTRLVVGRGAIRRSDPDRSLVAGNARVTLPFDLTASREARAQRLRQTSLGSPTRCRIQPHRGAFTNLLSATVR